MSVRVSAEDIPFSYTMIVLSNYRKNEVNCSPRQSSDSGGRKWPFSSHTNGNKAKTHQYQRQYQRQ